jgi:hypothetical protein
MTTIIHEQRETAGDNAVVEGDSLWLDAATIEHALGWHWKPQGLCRGDTCEPLPPGTEGAAMRCGDRLDLAAMWRHSRQPVVHDAARETWVFGTGAAERHEALATLEAPDFELPDLQGRLHRLSAWRGRKVFLGTWASW